MRVDVSFFPHDSDGVDSDSLQQIGFFLFFLFLIYFILFYLIYFINNLFY